jgi:hypothetical protein
MAYITGGTIQMIDYNYLTWGGNTTNTYSGTINNLAMVWGTGKGYKGYGQTVSPISATTQGTTVTATQWAGLVYLVNKTLGHQSGAGAQLATGSNIGITAGATIAAFANVLTAVTTINTNANTAATTGITTTGSVLTTALTQAGTNDIAAQTQSWTRTITFASGDAARYFFNAGGRINWVITATNNNATLRSADLVTNWATNQAGGFIAGATSDGKTGTGGTVNTDATTLGYWALTTSDQTMSQITSSNYRYEYNTDFTRIQVKSNGVQGANNDVGTVITFTFDYSMAGQIVAQAANFDDAIDVTFGVRFDIVEPEVTYLAKTWTNPSIA